MIPFNEQMCLETNPFEGDFGSPSDKTLKDKIVTTRKSCHCGMCKQAIVAGERSRVLVAIFDGDLMHYRFCSACCKAMELSWTDDGLAWEKQVTIGRQASELSRSKS